MNKNLIISAMAVLTTAGLSYGATLQTVSGAGGSPSTEGWTVTTGSGGEFASGTNWALFGSGSQAVRSIGSDLTIGQTVSIDISTLGVTAGTFVGVDFRDSGTTGLGYNFQGGGTNYGVFSSSGVTDSGVGFAASFKTVSVTRTSATDYTLDIDGTAFTSLTLAGGAGINEIRVFNDTSGSGNDILFNNLSVVPEPSSAALLGLGGLALILRRRK